MLDIPLQDWILQKLANAKSGKAAFKGLHAEREFEEVGLNLTSMPHTIHQLELLSDIGLINYTTHSREPDGVVYGDAYINMHGYDAIALGGVEAYRAGL